MAGGGVQGSALKIHDERAVEGRKEIHFQIGILRLQMFQIAWPAAADQPKQMPCTAPGADGLAFGLVNTAVVERPVNITAQYFHVAASPHSSVTVCSRG